MYVSPRVSIISPARDINKLEAQAPDVQSVAKRLKTAVKTTKRNSLVNPCGEIGSGFHETIREMINTGVLAGRTIFITGASRGIGKAIAIKAAKDGANVVIAAKTAEPHPKLPGTIYTAAQEVEQAGGQCLACVMDIRYEDQVVKAIKQAVEKFGGIDILVNNAGAINLTGTLDITMKRFDLMMAINVRGSFLTSKLCLPYLKKSKNPHILNITPPLNMRPSWYAENFAYAVSKYGVTLAVLGMSQEFKSYGIAVNALWPRTAIATVALESLAGDVGLKYSRKPEIMADAAYVIFQHTCDQMTGQFLIDEEVLVKAGVTDIGSYAVTPGTKFEVTEGPYFRRADAVEHSETIPAAKLHSVKDIFQKFNNHITTDIVKETQCVYLFDINGDKWLLNLKNGSGCIKQVDEYTGEDVKMMMAESVMVDLCTGKLNATAAFMSGKLKIKGDFEKAMKLEKLISKLAMNAKL